MSNIGEKTWRAFIVSKDLYTSLHLFAIDQNLNPDIVEYTTIRQSLYKIQTAKASIYILEYSPKESLLSYQLFASKAHALNSKVLLLCKKNQEPTFNWLKTTKIDHVETYPIDNNIIKETILKLLKDNDQKSDNTPCAKILAFIRFQPHSGAVTCALNTANLLAKKQNVLVIDFDNFFSPTATHCNLKPNKYLTELLDQPERIDHQLITSSVNIINKNLHLLSSSDDLTQNTNYSNGAIDQLLVSCSEIYKIIILHLPFSNTIHNHPGLILTDHIITVLNLNKATKDALSKFYPLLIKANHPDKFSFWVNNLEKHSDLSIDDFFQDLNIKACGEISHDHDLMAEAREENTLATTLNPDSKFAKELVQLLINMQLYENQPTKKWFDIKKLIKLWN